MATAAGTTVGDVRDVITTEATDPQIEAKLSDAEFEIDQSVETDLTTDHRQQLEKHLAALNIRLTIDRALAAGTGASTRVDFDGSEVDWLRSMVEDLDPSGELGGGAVRRDRDRHVTSTGGS